MQRQKRRSVGHRAQRLPIYRRNFLSPDSLQGLIHYLEGLHPIWEERYSQHRPPPVGEDQRRLLRPVYWLGNWQFACLGYFHPPKGLHERCVAAEPYPPALKKIVSEIELMTKSYYQGKDRPKNWKLNTCLINYYGDLEENGKKADLARVGEHQDFEPGPVASLSFGERALFQFVDGKSRAPRPVVHEIWTDDNSLIVFGGDQWKKHTFHRVQRVEKKTGKEFISQVPGFHVRRINLTFRYVPEEFIAPLSSFSPELRSDLSNYVDTLSKHSEFWRKLRE